MRILIENVGIVPMTGNNLVLEKGHIVIENDRIKEIAEERPGGDYDKIIDGTNRMAIPGFINAHTHAAMTLLRGYADDLPLMEWLETKIWPLESKMTADDIYWGTMLAATEMIKSGTTCFADMYFYMDKTAQAVDKSGMRAVLARGMIGIGPEAEQGLIDSRELVQKWNGSGDGRISFMLGPHAPYTCPPDYLKRVMDMAGNWA
jgi:5-methylthioadenosine/S-adenosylhomocysteine deaminase